jgi:chromosome segregation ATPase
MNDKESDMEEIEKRLEVLEEGMTQRRVVEHQILDIVERTDQTIQRIERKQDELIGSLRSLQAQQTIFDARLSILDTRQKDDLSAINARFDRISEKNDKIFQALQSHDQFAELREKVEVQIEGKITGLQTEMHQSFDRQDKQIADLRGDMNVQLNEIKLLFAALVPKPDQGA